MLDRAHRLRRRTDFTRTVRHGRRASRGTVVVHLHRAGGSSEPAGNEASPARVGFVVSRAVGGAVVRNRVRRRLRHAVREHLPELAPGVMLVVRAQPAAARAGGDRLRADLAEAVRAALAREPAPGRVR